MVDTLALPEIPVIDARLGGVAAIAHDGRSRLEDLFAHARRVFTPALLGLGDRIARRWLMRNANPYSAEIEGVARLLGSKGAFALNTLYEWCCTAGVCESAGGDPQLRRVLDWRLSGLGRNLVAAWQRGPAGDYVNLTWPGFVGVITAMAPGRFAVAINQPPMPSWSLGLPIDWLIGRVSVWRSRELPPAHLLRAVCERCTDYAEAKEMLVRTPLCLPSFFTLAGINRGEGCVIERTAGRAAVRDMPAAVANHWVTLPERGRPRGERSRDRLAVMERAVYSGGSWLEPPVVNRFTRLVAEIIPATGKLAAQGWEQEGPVTARLVLG